MVSKAKTPSRPTDLAGAASGEEVRLFHDIVRKHAPFPKEVRDVQLRFGEDSVGAPAVWIVLIAKDELNPSEETLSAIGRFADQVRSEIWDTGTDRWPYITIEVE